MKRTKLFLSVAAVAVASCMTAAVASAADAVEFKLDTAKSTESSKVINVYYTGDSLKDVAAVAYLDFYFDGISIDDITYDTDFTDSVDFSEYDGAYSFCGQLSKGGLAKVDGSALLATFTVNTTDDVKVETGAFEMTDGLGVVTDADADVATFAVVDAEDLGVFADGEGAAVKAYKAAAAVDGTITWNVTDGENVATAESSVSGGADVIVGLRVAGANVANIKYAAVTID